MRIFNSTKLKELKEFTMSPASRAKGFSVIEALVVFLVLVLLVFGIWYVWHKNKDQPTQTSKTDSSQTQPDQTANHKPDPSEGGKYLAIKEWGVRFPLSESLQGDVTYGIDEKVELESGDNSSTIPGKVAYFTSKNLVTDTANACALTAEEDGSGFSGGLVALSRSEDRPSPFSETQDHYLGGMYYSIEKSNGGVCSSETTGLEESNFIHKLINAISALESINVRIDKNQDQRSRETMK